MQLEVVGDAVTAGKRLAGLFKWADPRSVDIAYAWARSKEGEAEHWRTLDLTKLRRAVIGTQFAQTEPWVLTRLRDEIGDYAKVMLCSHGTFHPKLAIARRGDRVRILLGSSNLTPYAFSINTELNVIIEGDEGDPEIVEITRFFSRAWRSAKLIRDDWLAEYRIDYARRPRPSGLVSGAVIRISSIEDLEIDWSQYVRLIESHEGRETVSGFVIPLFNGSPSYFSEFEKMLAAYAATGDGRFVSLKKKQRLISIGLTKDSSGLLGRMAAPYLAKIIVKDRPHAIGRHLDKISLRGKISWETAYEVMDGLCGIKGVKIGVASRLLVAKRPDVFISVNEGSRPGLTPITDSLLETAEEYMELLEALWRTPWFNSERPKLAREQRIWDRRVAILDAAIYEGKG